MALGPPAAVCAAQPVVLRGRCAYLAGRSLLAGPFSTRRPQGSGTTLRSSALERLWYDPVLRLYTPLVQPGAVQWKAKEG